MLMGTRRRGAYALVFEGLKGSEYSPSFKTSKGAADGVCPRGRVASGGRESFEGRQCDAVCDRFSRVGSGRCVCGYG